MEIILRYIIYTIYYDNDLICSCHGLMTITSVQETFNVVFLSFARNSELNFNSELL